MPSANAHQNRRTDWANIEWRMFLNEVMREQFEEPEERRALERARGSNELCWEADDEPEPLVTVRIATYNRGDLLVQRAINSVRRQTYKRLEILVVGDRCDEATAAAASRVRDDRLRFLNLAFRGDYPFDRIRQWMVAGASPMNAALMLANGKWIAPCDDDDEFTPDHVERLLQHARASRFEFVWSKAQMETTQGVWAVIGSPVVRPAGFCHGTVIYSSRLRNFRHSTTSWILNEPSDWNLWKRMRRAGVRMGFLPEVTYRHYLEGYRRPLVR